jgi:hypothetical protein
MSGITNIKRCKNKCKWQNMEIQRGDWETVMGEHEREVTSNEQEQQRDLYN